MRKQGIVISNRFQTQPSRVIGGQISYASGQTLLLACTFQGLPRVLSTTYSYAYSLYPIVRRNCLRFLMSSSVSTPFGKYHQ